MPKINIHKKLFKNNFSCFSDYEKKRRKKSNDEHTNMFCVHVCMCRRKQAMKKKRAICMILIERENKVGTMWPFLYLCAKRLNRLRNWSSKQQKVMTIVK